MLFAALLLLFCFEGLASRYGESRAAIDLWTSHTSLTGWNHLIRNTGNRELKNPRGAKSMTSVFTIYVNTGHVLPEVPTYNVAIISKNKHGIVNILPMQTELGLFGQPTYFADLWLTSPNSTMDYVVVGVNPATRSTFRLKTVDNSSVGLAFCQYSKQMLNFTALCFSCNYADFLHFPVLHRCEYSFLFRIPNLCSTGFRFQKQIFWVFFVLFCIRTSSLLSR